MAHPLTTISEKANARFQAIAKLIQEWQPVRLIVGLPLHMDGAEHEMTEHCRAASRANCKAALISKPNWWMNAPRRQKHNRCSPIWAEAGNKTNI